MLRMAMASSAPARRRAGKRAEKRNETRERLLDVALDLFTRNGYAETSLREIAAELGVSKAALYYHFESKGDILLALHMRLHEIGKAALAELEVNETDVDRWRLGLHRLIDLVLSHRKLFELHARNHAALEQLQRTAAEHAREHDDLEGRFRAVGTNPALPLETRARIVGAMGAVMDVAMWGSDVQMDVSEREFAAILRRIVDDLLAER
jgi:AcrR family transcriptional regulator